MKRDKALSIAVLAGLAIYVQATWPKSEPDHVPSARPPFSAKQVEECRSVINKARVTSLIREEPSSDRINVDELKWAMLPASAKTGIALGVGCANLGRPFRPLEYVSVYGYRSGKKLAQAGSTGVVFE